MNTDLDDALRARSLRKKASRSLQIAACHISFASTHVRMFTYVRAIARSKCNATPRDPLAGLARSHRTPADLLVANAIFRRAHLSVIRMPIARLENDYGHERRCRSEATTLLVCRMRRRGHDERRIVRVYLVA